MKVRIAIILYFLFIQSCAFEEPYFMAIGVDNCGGITIDNKFTSIKEIPVAVYLETKDLDSSGLSKFYVKLKIAESSNINQVKSVENELRKLNVLKVKYYEMKDSSCGY